ncbi:MAG: 50S ribosomal protein L4 [Oscillospiraceae bacterium]|nr:50S ribosomal protein L4 [Oscillospiraceae bacterium]
MAKVNVYNMSGEAVSEIELSSAVFEITPNVSVMHAVVKAYLANQRQGTQSAKTRSEVSGGGRKPWRQKGTGRARQGSIRAVQWKGGGVAFAPKPRDYRQSVNKKVRALAMRSALSAKLANGELVVVDQIALEEYKTKKVVEMLKALNVERKALIVLPEKNDYLVKSAANIPGVKTALTNTINVYDILNGGKFVVTVDAIKRIEEVYAK